MPVSSYFRGSGVRVLASMKKRYGAEKGEEVFYATAKAKGMEPGDKKKAPKKRYVKEG